MTRFVSLFLRRLTVVGDSMAPTYRDGERLTALRRWRRVRVGDVVVVPDPRDSARPLLKRCVAREGRRLDLRGDNAAASTDSRDFGLVEEASVHWLVAKRQS
ncbi:MAG: S24/S26 family peptidase [Acidimicrobiales bacterium]